MKFTPEVIAALQVLRDNATNDFERHRIDVLERDLTAPPQVEIINDKHQRFDGVVYRKINSGHFTSSNAIHRAIWTYYIGDISDDCQIHHIDHNPANNNIENLQCLTRSEHQALHMATDKRLEKRKTILICKNCGREYVGYFSGNNAFCSEKCRKEFYLIEKTCPVCGKKFHTRFNATCCSKKCAAKKRYAVKKKCLNCGRELTRSSRKYCSPKCYYEHKKFREHVSRYEERTCAICGKSFMAYKYARTVTCSKECRYKSMWQNRRNKK